jgi:hypothetical protein
MGMLGKALAVVNVVAAIAFMCVLGLDYGRRQAWTFANLQQDFIINGLPVDDKELDVQGFPLADSVGPRMKRELFAAAPGLDVSTQVAYVQIRQGQLQGDQAKAALLNLAENAAQRAEFRAMDDNQVAARLDQEFQRVLSPSKTGTAGEGLSLTERRQAIAHLLFTTSLTDEDRNRALAVVGLSSYVRAVNSQANNCDKMIQVFNSQITSDRTLFEVKRKALMEKIFALAERVQKLKQDLEKQTAVREQHKVLVKKRTDDKAELLKNIASTREAVKAASDQLKKIEDETFAAEKAVTVTDQRNQELERTLESLELGR